MIHHWFYKESQMFVRIAGLPRRIKIFIMLFCDVILLPLALYSAIALRLGTIRPEVSPFWWLFLAIPFLTVPIFVRVGLYRAVIRYMDDRIIATVFYGVSLSVLLLTAAVVMGNVTGVPRSSIVIYWIIAIAYITSSRFIARGVLRSLEREQDRRQPVAIYGAGRSGLQTALALMSGPEFRPVAFFDDNRQLHGTSVAGIRVYSPDEALNIMGAEDCNQLLIAMPSASRSRRREIIQRFENVDIRLKTLPGIGELVDGKVRIEDIREVGVEDLLGRDPVPPFEDLIKSCIRDKVVLVTGAGGSIGSELCRQIILNTPKKLIIFEQAEYALYKIEQDILKHRINFEVVPVLGDVLNTEHLEKIIASHGVQTIYHAAAYKHVPLVESNVIAGIVNNVFGTLSASKAAIKCKVETFVLISTDKAVRPTNIMGASKRLAELVLQGLSQDKSHSTRFCMVRFGNVLGSSGSVVPLFKEQIRHGGPVTVTHPDITRYFMTIPEAAQLVLQAGAMGKGGDVFVLDMGESVKIVDLAKKMIELSGLEVRNPDTGQGDISIEFTGLRPGEKLYEELLIGENVSWTAHPRIMTAEEASIELSKLMQSLDQMRSACSTGDEPAVREVLKRLVPEYKPT
ncbi:nucleoside-diphosphate sugar epimerase/dehydratase [Bdellovibrio bacteriovorus]|uniref:Nucleotide sugar epimerase/dehydratase n=1 Tax=Bdellovibrio bacteriovorus (strain ATCC 15356 / DSM 50701 / NCIMB 9529 / HD100) TaxID=264462 RepID=Q6MMD5_BDEBA|nr:nucleoside-diphosphate sugar epimerase/dehydratase [Bdellovibrio bacteriovorus]CAE79570.1 Nucleotide sugar epimerase/dehydratase [Bdellovibrio bacteriovorus HD100]